QLVALGARITTEHAHPAFERDQAEHRLERGGLAGPVGADQADDASFRHLESSVAERELVLVGLAQVARAAHRIERGADLDVGVHQAPALAEPAASRSSALRPRRRMRSSTSGHSSVRKRSRSLTSSFFAASSVTYMPRPLRFSTSASSANSW